MLLVVSLNSRSHTQSHLAFLLCYRPGVLCLTFRSIIHSGLLSLKDIRSVSRLFFLACGSSQVALVVKNPPDSAGDLRDAGLIPGSGRSLGGGYGSPLQFSCLENSMDRGAWWATAHRVVKSWIQVKWLSMHPAPFVKKAAFSPLYCLCSLLKISWLHSWPLNYAGSPICGFVVVFFFSIVSIMAPYSNTLAWKIPWMEEPGRLQSVGSQRVGHDWAMSLSLFTFIGEGNGNPLQCSCLESPRDGGAWWAAIYGVAQSRTRLTRLSSSSSITVLHDPW